MAKATWIVENTESEKRRLILNPLPDRNDSGKLAALITAIDCNVISIISKS